MIAEENPKAPAPKKTAGDKAIDRRPQPVAVDRPGFDLGGSTGKTNAGAGLGLGKDAAENRRDRRLPGRRDKSTQSAPVQLPTHLPPISRSNESSGAPKQVFTIVR
jgi:hypothetical protein